MKRYMLVQMIVYYIEKKYDDIVECPFCSTSRWQKKKSSTEVIEGVPAKVLWNLFGYPQIQELD